MMHGRATLAVPAGVTALTLAALLAGACTSERPAATGGAGRDGTSEQAAAPSVPVWRLGTAPRVRIASDDAIDLGDVSAVAVLSSGEIVVATMYPPGLHVFGSDGAFARSIGRRGRGPGEFTSVDRVDRLGDTLVVFDLEEVAQRFLPSGSFLGAEARPEGGGRLLGLFANGDRLVSQLDRSDIAVGASGPSVERLERVGRGARRPLGAFPSQSFRRDGEGRYDSDVYAPHNRAVALADGFCAGFSGGQRIGCFDGAGRPSGELLLTHRERVAVTDADREAYFGDVYIANSDAPRAQVDAEVARMRERRTFAKDLGYFGRLLAGRDSLVWVGPPSTDSYRFANPNALPDSATTWSVFTRDGRWVAEVRLPPRFLPLEVRAGYVAGITRDADDEVVVLVFDLITR